VDVIASCYCDQEDLTALAKYIGIQVIAYAIDMGLFAALLYAGYFGPIIANVFGKLAAGIFAFILHRSFTFKLQKDEHDHSQVWKYFLLLGANIPLTALILAGFLLFITMPVYAKLASDVIAVLLSFWLSKNWVFKRSK